MSEHDIRMKADQALELQGMTGDVGDMYHVGIYNGIEYLRSCLLGEEPVYMDKDGKLDEEAKANSPERFI